MVYINPYIKVNAGGIPRLEATGVTSSDNLVYTFKSHRFLNYPYVGLLIFKLPATTATSTAGTVYFNTSGGNKVQVYDNTGTAVVSNNAKLIQGGVFIGWYDNGELMLLTGLA